MESKGKLQLSQERSAQGCPSGRHTAFTPRWDSGARGFPDRFFGDTVSLKRWCQDYLILVNSIREATIFKDKDLKPEQPYLLPTGLFPYLYVIWTTSAIQETSILIQHLLAWQRKLRRHSGEIPGTSVLSISRLPISLL